MSDVNKMGMGALLYWMSDRSKTAQAMKSAIGRVISTIELKDNVAIVTFEDGAVLRLWDDAQSCCESRYMTTDDDLSAYAGATLVSVEVRSGESKPTSDDYDDEHEVQFLVLLTNRGNITFENHNQHNGYYGGFGITASIEGVTDDSDESTPR